MKRLLAVLLIIWIACFKLKGSDSFEYGQFYFSLDNDSVVSVAGILDTNAIEIRIPSSIYLDNKLFKVQNIQEGVFQKCRVLSSLAIPNSIREIPVSIFSECQSLSDVFVEWSSPDSTFLFCPLADNSSDFIRLTAGMNLHVPSGSIKTYLNTGYPWIGFKSISDGNESIEVQTFISDGDIFNISDHDNKHVFAVFRERKGEFTVPAMVWSEKDSTFYTITGIGCRSFLNNKELTRVVLPESITEISFEAFRGCDNLMSIQMNDSISIIGSRAFYGCNRIDTIHFAQKLSSIDDYAFYGCGNLQEVILPYNMRYLGNYTFEGCYGLRKVCLNDGLHHIGRACFKKCRMLDCIKIPETVDYIGYEAFEGCLNLRSVFVSWPGLSLLPKSFKIAFNINSMTELFVKPILMDSIIDNGIPAELTSFIHITDGMRSSMERAFISDSILYTVEDMKEKKVTARKIMANKSKIVIPGKVKSEYTDYVVTNVIISLNNRGCDSLIVSEGIRCMTGSLGAVELGYLYLPSTLDTVELRYPLTLKSIGPIGSGCDIEYGWDEKIPDNSFRGLLSLETVVISEDIKTIGRNAFDWCTSLEELVMPSSMEEIGSEAFAGCYNLKKIKINNNGSTKYLNMSVAEGTFPDMSLLEKAVADAATHEKLKTGDIIRGVVRDSDGNPVNMVYVKELDSEGRIIDHDLTESNGKFSLRLSNPANRIEFYSMGYETVNLPLNTAYYLIDLIEKPDTAVIVPSRKKDLSGSHRRHEYVDLGLSVKWATCNVGGKTPDDPGGLYAWGETEEKNRYSWSNYRWCKGDEYELTKYCTVDSYGYNGFADNKTVLAPEDDVAHKKWGGRWRMPTVDEFMELCMNCTWTWTTCNNVQGYRITSRIPGYEDSSIFLPTCDDYSALLPFNEGFHGEYMSSTLSPNYPSSCYILRFTSEQVDWNGYRRQFSRSVRPVCQ